MINRELLAPCGLYCGICAIRLAWVSDDPALKQKVAKLYGVEEEQIVCDGCMSPRRFVFCQACAIRDCAQSKGLDGCAACAEFPCSRIEKFPVPAGLAFIRQEVPRWRELGAEAWVADLERRHACPSCGGLIMRGARRCHACGVEASPAGV